MISLQVPELGRCAQAETEFVQYDFAYVRLRLAN